jgi:Tfp pilus assembly protein PilN
MIKINLALKKQASYVTSGKTGTNTRNFNLKGAFSGGVADLATQILVPLILCLALYYGTDYYTQQKTQEMQSEVGTLEKEKDRINTELARIHGFETVKTQLEANSHLLQTKIETIEKLVRGRDFTVKSLVALSQALPKEVWLTKMTATDGAYSITGSTVDLSFISDFMTHLGQSIYFKDIALKSSTSDPTGRQSNFELSARRE